MAAEDLLTDEQFAVIIVAVEEATVADVMDEYRARQRWAETGSTLTPSDLDDDAKRAMIPQFVDVLTDMVARGWIDLWWGMATSHSVKVPRDQVPIVLRDTACWIKSTNGDWHMVGMTTTDLWDELTNAHLGRRFSFSESQST